MLFDATLRVVGIEIQAEENYVQLVQLLGLGLPTGPGQIMPIPAGLLRTPLGKEAALKHGQELIDAANQLPDETPESPLVVASSLEGVDKVVNIDKKFRGE